MTEYSISVIIPAHNEETVVARLLESLSDHTADDEIIVVCDGCSDRTAEIARSFAGVTVVEQARGGKPSALNSGDRQATLFPRFYVDADIVVTASALYEVAKLMSDSVEAGAPRCEVDTSNSSWIVRRYYDVWTRLPYFNEHLMGSGIIGITRRGRERFFEFPRVINDDGFIRRLFTVDERVHGTLSSFLVMAPTKVGALVRIKTRVRLGEMQLNMLEGLPSSAIGCTTRSALKKLLISPRMWPAIVVFFGVKATVESRALWRFRRRNFDGWARDESTRLIGYIGPGSASQERFGKGNSVQTEGTTTDA